MENWAYSAKEKRNKALLSQDLTKDDSKDLDNIEAMLVLKWYHRDSF